MRGNTCPSSTALARAFSNGASANISAHLLQCETCARQWTSFEQVKDLARDLPTEPPSWDRVESVRSALLAEASEMDAVKKTPHRAVWKPLAIAASVVLAVGASFLLMTTEHDQEPTQNPTDSNGIRLAEIHPHHGTGYVVLRSQPDEIVRLTHGTITVGVKTLGKSERFRVITGDAEVEVRGAAFAATAEHDSLTAVSVKHGFVEVRPTGLAVVMLNPGEHWARPMSIPELNGSDSEKTEIARDIAEPDAEEKKRTGKKRKNRAAQSLPNPKREQEIERDVIEPDVIEPDDPPSDSRDIEPGPAEIAFGEGWRALRRGDPKSAIRAFEQAISAPGSNDIAEDASYWLAVAYGRAGAHSKAMQALKTFLSSYPGSPRSGEASAMLGWKLFDLGDLDRAERLFRAALNDPVPRVRKSAKQGLDEIKRLSKSP
ncbi:MAG: tetratricopeptide repeat protein [Myxococcota bacterium]|nr:tetratricopeptide repeat protein [Myxococcota bacterium]